MNAQGKQPATLMNETSKELHRAGDRLVETIVRIESAMDDLQNSLGVPTAVQAHLEEVELGAEQLTQCLYAAMGTHALVLRNWTYLSHRREDREDVKCKV